MKSSKHQSKRSYVTLFQQIEAIQQHADEENRKSPSIAEISAILGDSEEHILECLEFVQSNNNIMLSLH